MWWKIYFWITVGELLLQFLGLFVNPGTHIATQIVVFFIFAIAVIGMYGYAFQKRIFSQLFWQYFTGIYVLIDLIYLIYAAFSHAPVISSLSFLEVYPNPALFDVLVGVAIDIPLIYAMYRLTKDEPFAKEKEVKKAKGESYRWGMTQTALWGYSIVLVFYLFVIAFFPVGNATVVKDQASDPYFIAGTFAPLIIFWIWVVLQYKKYKWNWWRTTLAANGILYSGMIFWGIIFSQKEQGVQSNLGGIDIISLLQLLIMLLGLWVFGRTQFQKEEKKK